MGGLGTGSASMGTGAWDPMGRSDDAIIFVAYFLDSSSVRYQGTFQSVPTYFSGEDEAVQMDAGTVYPGDRGRYVPTVVTGEQSLHG